MKKILKLWEELKYSDEWSNEEIIDKINQLVEWTHEHDNIKEQTNDNRKDKENDNQKTKPH